MLKHIALGAFHLLATCLAVAQTTSGYLEADDLQAFGDMGEDPAPALSGYERFNWAIEGDSLRQCAGFPCIGWVEDTYPGGGLQHRGYYDQGKVTIYKNYYADGTLEREFRSIDASNSIQRLFHPNGQLRSETKYRNGSVASYEDHYVNGALRYAEERHRSEPYYLRMDLYNDDGTPVSLLHLVDKKRVEFSQKEFYPGGAIRCEGKARYDPARMDTQRIGTWTYYDRSGAVLRTETYQDGRLASGP